MNRLKRIAIFAIHYILFFCANAQAQQVCYTVSDSKDSLYQFILSSGKITKQSYITGASSIEAATLNLKGDTFWMLNQDELYYVKTTSSSFTPTKISGSNISGQTLSGTEGNLTISDFDAMSVDTAGNIWAGNTSTNPSLLVVIDRSTGLVKEDYFGSGKDYLKVDNSSYNYLRFDAMAFDPITNELFANFNGSSSLYDFVFKVNTTTGAMTLVRQFTTIDDIEGMGFDALGDLYVTTGSNCSNSSNNNTYWKVDIVTGLVTKIYNLTGGDMETCDCIVGDPIKSNEVSGYFFYDDDWDGNFDNSGSDTGEYNHLMCLYRDVNENSEFNSGVDTLLDTTRTYESGYYKFRFLYDQGTEYYLVVADTNELNSDEELTTPMVEAVQFSSGATVSPDHNIGVSFDGNKISGFVVIDNDLSGTKTDGDVGSAGITVNLYRDNNSNGSYDPGTDSYIDSVDSENDGSYTFVVEYGGGTERYLTFITLSDLGANDSMITDNIETFSFTSDKNHSSSANFCYYTSLTKNIITGKIYADADEDSTYDSYEDRVANVKVLLYSDANGNGEIDGADAAVDSVTVAENGFYVFQRDYNSSETTLNYQLSSSTDDAEQYGSSVYTSYDDIWLADAECGFRFQSIAIPQGATITEAYLQFRAEASSSDAANTTIYGHDVDDSWTFSTSSNDVSSRTKTSASAAWTFTSWTAGTWYNTPDVKSVVQEIVNRGSWTSGNDMTFIVEAATGRRDAYQYDNSSNNAPKLVIKYQTGSGGNDCYVIKIDENTAPSGATLTHTNKRTVCFTSGGNIDRNNNFGLWGGSLPVEWLTFDGEWMNEDVLLNWSTASEENNDYFEIQRSVDSKTWETIGTVAGAGNSTQINEYTFVDTDPNAGLNYYRLLQMDFNGDYSYSNIIVLDNSGQSEGVLNVYPNPAKDFVQLDYDVKKHQKVEVWSANGLLVHTVEINPTDANNTTINTSAWVPGLYIVRAYGSKGIDTFKLTIRN